MNVIFLVSLTKSQFVYVAMWRHFTFS